MSANELSRQTRVPQSTITRILNGDVKDPRTQQLEKIATFFGITASQLRGDVAVAVLHDEARPAGDGKEVKEKFYQAYVSLQEMDLLNAYRSSNEIGKRAIVAATNALAKEYPAQAAGSVSKIRS